MYKHKVLLSYDNGFFTLKFDNNLNECSLVQSPKKNWDKLNQEHTMRTFLKKACKRETTLLIVSKAKANKKTRGQRVASTKVFLAEHHQYSELEMTSSIFRIILTT